MHIPSIYPIKKGWVVLLAGIVLLATGCGSSTTPLATSAPATQASVLPGGLPSIPKPIPTLPGSTIGNAGSDPCTILTDAEIGEALGVGADTIQRNNMGATCTYASGILIIDLTFTPTGGIQMMKSLSTNLGDLALVVAGLGDQALYNTNSSNALFVLKGDTVFLIQMSDMSDQALDPVVVRAAEKTLAEKILGRLP